MPPKREKEAIVFLLDIGKNMEEMVQNSNVTFLESSKNCISQIIQRKIFSNSSDELGLILFGCEKTENKLADGSGYDNIAVVTEHLALANWELLRYVTEQKINECSSADWLDAIVVAMQFVKDETEQKVFAQHKIVIFSNFAYPVSDSQAEIIVSGLKQLDIDFVVIGPDITKNEYLPGEKKSLSQASGEILVSNIVEELNGVICSFEEAMPELLHFQRKNVKPTPWNAMFTVSSKIKIPIRAFKKIAETTPMKWITTSLDDKDASVIKEKAFIRYDHEKEVEIVLEKENVIDAYQFGSTIVPFSDDDKRMMRYDSGEKGLFLIGYTPKGNIALHMLIGIGSYIILSKQDDEVAKITLEAIIEAMYQKNYVGIARRIYNVNSAVTIGALFPVVTEESRYLIFTELPFAEDEHNYKFPSLSNVEPTVEQVNLVDSIIEKMDLDEIEGDLEKYDITRIYDHQEQFSLRCVSHKALYPNEQIPESIADSIKLHLEPLPELLKLCEDDLERFKTLFQLEEIPEKSRRKMQKTEETSNETNNDVLMASNLFQNSSKAYITETKQGIDLLLSKRKSFIEVFQEMKNIVENLIYSESRQIEKIIPEIESMRKLSISNDPTIYNEWIINFKKLLCSKLYFSIRDDLITVKLGLITNLEASNSNVTDKEAEEFLKTHSEVDSLYGTQGSVDLLDEI